jgi:hypothetical protein
LLLLSVATALAILFAGGVLLLQLAVTESSAGATPIGEAVEVGDATVTVVAADNDGGDLMSVELEIGGVDDPEWLDTVRLVTGDRQLAPAGPADDRCVAITVVPQRCVLLFDVSGSDASNRVLVMRRGEDRATWSLER